MRSSEGEDEIAGLAEEFCKYLLLNSDRNTTVG